ncbi:MAG: EAL domain-containing protein [Lachnospiraceae bacterium]|nr:EAL domain-containing protein [Lachnospiraceae bacterium]
MKSLYIILFLLNIFGLFMCVLAIGRSKNKLAPFLNLPIISAMFPIAFSMIIVSATSEIVANIGYSVFCASINWVIYNFLMFTSNLTAIRPKRRLWHYLACCLIGTDSLIILLNPLTDTAFTVYPKTFGNAQLYYLPLYGTYFYLHLTISYLICLAILVLLLYKMYRTPVIYWWRYLTILISFLVLVIWDGISTFFQTYVNISCIGYSISAIMITVFTLAVKPYVLIDRMLRYVVEDLGVMIIFFDLDRVPIYANDAAISFFRLQEEDFTASVYGALKEWLGEENVAKGEFAEREQVIEKVHHGRVYHLAFHWHEMVLHGRLIGAFLQISDQSEYHSNLARERFHATHDALTGLYSKEYFLEIVDQRLREDPETEYVIVASDIRDFKLINDVFGREAGDRILIRIADKIMELSTEKALYGRIGSDKFCVLMEKSHYSDQLFIEQPKEVAYVDDHLRYPVICHVGVIDADPSVAAGILIDRCYIAISQIKNDYERRVVRYDDVMRKQMLWENRVTGELDDAIRRKEFVPYLQPQIDKNGKLCGAEVLVRWQHPTEGLIMPGRFIGILEKNGLIAKLDSYIWQQACVLLSKWQDTELSELPLSVNISPRDFYFTDIFQTFVGLTQRYGIDPKKLHLEITETVMMTDVDRRIELLDKLHGAGFLVEMDDFGSGFSSLNLLKDTDVDVLKIDMGFLRESADSERSKQILLFVINLAHQLGLHVICEGVETREQLELLTEAGCEMFQGYYFSKPVDVEMFVEELVPKYLKR